MNELDKQSIIESLGIIQEHLEDPMASSPSFVRIRLEILDQFMAAVNPPPQTDADYQKIFGRTQANFEQLIARAREYAAQL